MSDIVCPVCFRHCALKEGQTGFCKARMNRNGESVCVNYGKVTSLALDPVEKKPFAMFYPSKKVLSVGSFGCNLDCPFCQNSEISRAGENAAEWRKIEPDELAGLAESMKNRGNIGAAFTYNEPMVGYEYVRDCAKAVRGRGMKNVIVTNGSVELPILDEVLPFADAFNIDLKSFTPEGYEKLNGNLNTVLNFIRRAAGSVHVELTALIVPGENDSENEMRELSSWVASVNRNIPLHITRFFPRYKMCGRDPTDITLLYRLEDIAKESLDTVLVGNV